MSTRNNKPTTSFGNLKEIKKCSLLLFLLHVYPWSHNTFITDILWQNHISSRLVNFRWTKIDDACTNTQTVLPIILLHYIFTYTHTHTHTHTEANFAFHWIHNHNANQIPPATFSPLHTKFPAIKISRTKTMFYFLTHVVLSPGSLIHPHTLIWEKPTYGLLNPV